MFYDVPCYVVHDDVVVPYAEFIEYTYMYLYREYRYLHTKTI